MKKTSRFRKVSPTKRTAIPVGWSTAVTGQSSEDCTALFESTAHEPYDGNEAAWDRVLELLGFSLSLQPAVAKILSQDGWRSAKDPKAYVATAAWRQHSSMKLVDYDCRDFRVVSTGRLDDDSDHRPDVSVDHGGNERPISDLERLDNHMHHVAVRQHLYDDDTPQIPAWLQRPDESDRVDWSVVAQYAALKPAMRPSLARALDLRFSQGLTRQTALLGTKGNDQRHKLEAAWRWIDRNIATRIAPLFSRERAPHSMLATERRTSRKGNFISPGEALRRTLSSRLPKPNDYVPAPSLRQSENPLHLPPGVELTWGRGRYGMSATLRDRNTGMGIQVEGEIRNEVLQQVQEILSDWADCRERFVEAHNRPSEPE